MAGGKESPRQKMIGMMYLVLTAMLALNVTKQVLNAFAVVNDGLKITNKNYDEKNAITYQQFVNAMKSDSARARPFYIAAMKAQKLSKAMCIHIDSLKTMLISKTNGDPWDTAAKTSLMAVDESSKGNFDVTTRVMVNTSADEDGSKGVAHILKTDLHTYRQQMLALLAKPSDSNTINIGLSTKGGYNFSHEYQNWEQYNFEEQPLAAAVVTLTRLQNEVKNAETTVIQKLLTSIKGDTYVIDKLDPVVLTETPYVLIGDSFHSEIFLSASQKTQKPIITIDSIDGHAVDKTKVGVSADGMGMYSTKPTTEGERKFAGTIMVKDPKDPTGQLMTPYHFRSSYLAAKPSSIVSPSKMNVFYIGVDNPVDISAAGFSDKDLTASINIGSIVPAPTGGYVVRIPQGTPPTKPGAPPSCTINVTGKMPDKKNKDLGPHPFRIKRVPDPYCYFAGKKGDIYLTKGELSAYDNVTAKLDNFDFDLHYDVTSFEMNVTVGGLSQDLPSDKDKISDKMKKVLKGVTRGAHIIIQNVHVKSPAGSATISGVNIIVN